MHANLRTLLATSAVAAAALALTACASTSARSASGPMAAAVYPTAIATPTATATTTSAARHLVLDGSGLGRLKLGISLPQAKATGMVDHIAPVDWSECRAGLLKGADQTQNEGLVVVSDNLGVAAIYAYGDIATPEGIKLGSTDEQVHAAYPSWIGIEGKEGHGHIKVPGSSTAVYRINIDNGVVTELDVQLANQDCYE